MRRLDSIIDETDINLGKLWEMVRKGRPGVLQSMGLQRVGHNWQLNKKLGGKKKYIIDKIIVKISQTF